MTWLSVTGLVLNVIGSVLFIIDTNRLSGLLASIVKQMVQDHGKMDSKVFSKAEILQLQTRIVSSKKLTTMGYIFFISGFLMQLVSYY